MAAKKDKKPAARKPKGNSGKPKGSPRKLASKALLNYRHMHALAKEQRVRIFAIFCERIASPNEIAIELNEGLSQVSYHVKVLRECRLIVLDHEVPRRGAVEHFYRAASPTLIPPDSWRRLPPAMRKGVSGSIMQQFLDDAAAAMEADVFDEPPGELSWTPLILDDPGVEEFGQLARDFLASVSKLQTGVNKRLKGTKSKAADQTAATVFLATFLSARSPKEGKKASAAKRR